MRERVSHDIVGKPTWRRKRKTEQWELVSLCVRVRVCIRIIFVWLLSEQEVSSILCEARPWSQTCTNSQTTCVLLTMELKLNGDYPTVRLTGNFGFLLVNCWDHYINCNLVLAIITLFITYRWNMIYKTYYNVMNTLSVMRYKLVLKEHLKYSYCTYLASRQTI